MITTDKYTKGRYRFYPDVTDEQWNDWKWQVKNRIETLDQLKKFLPLTP
jgi:lysine 2,3-aminomutase